MNKTAEQLVEEYKNGKAEALGELVEMYRRPLFGFILSLTEGDDAEEIFQEAWFKAIKGMKSYRSKSFLSWMFRITHNLVIDRVRKKKPDCSLNDPIGDQSLELQDTVCSHHDGPDLHSGNNELKGRIAAAVSTLPLEQKEVFLMRTEGDLSFRDIASIQKTSINTALARMQYALSKLRVALEEDYQSLPVRRSS